MSYEINSKMKFMVRRGSSVVERKPEELSVVGSIPTLGTSLFRLKKIKQAIVVHVIQSYIAVV